MATFDAMTGLHAAALWSGLSILLLVVLSFRTIFTRKRLFLATIKEISDMRIFFSFCNAQLFKPQCGNIFPKTIVYAAGRIGCGQVKVFPIAAECREVGKPGEICAGKAIKFRVGERACELTCPVSAEIHKHGNIAVLHTDRGIQICCYGGCLHKFIIQFW